MPSYIKNSSAHKVRSSYTAAIIYSVLKSIQLIHLFLVCPLLPYPSLPFFLPAQLYSDHSRLLHVHSCLSARVLLLHSFSSAVLDSYCELFPRRAL